VNESIISQDDDVFCLRANLILAQPRRQQLSWLAVVRSDPWYTCE